MRTAPMTLAEAAASRDGAFTVEGRTCVFRHFDGGRPCVWQYRSAADARIAYRNAMAAAFPMSSAEHAIVRRLMDAASAVARHEHGTAAREMRLALADIEALRKDAAA